MPRRAKQGMHPLSVAIAWALAAPMVFPATDAAAQDVNLGALVDRGFRIDGIDAGDQSGFSVSGAGDVNGDGLADLIVGAPRGFANNSRNAGEAYVVFGRAGTTTVDLANLGAGGFLISGIRLDDYAGHSVSGAGDVNGDGLADLIVGAFAADPGNVSGAGQAFVVFGRTATTPVNLANLGAGGFRIDGADDFGIAGDSVSGAGDVNGDGRADLIIGAPGTNGGAGRAFVVFGRTATTPVNLGNLGAGGFRIDGISPSDYTGTSVSGAGDFNGDGLADLIIGASNADPGGRSGAGTSHIVFGRTQTTPVDLANLGSGGLRIEGIDPGDFSGYSVAGAGDVNGDGLADVVIGARGADPSNCASAGESYVVFGRQDTKALNLANLGTSGFRIDGASALDNSGASVAGAGDVNGDGRADVIIGARLGDPGGDESAGESYVVFGGNDFQPVDLANLGSAGFRIDGIDVQDRSGYSVSGAGDVNGDGLADLIIGAADADPGNDGSAGESYVVFSAAVPPQAATFVVLGRDGDPPRLPVGTSGDGSNDDTPDARFWIDFADGSAPPDAAFIETVTLFRPGPAFAAPAAAVFWRLETTRQDWTSAEVRVRYVDRELRVANENTLRLFHSVDGGTFTPLASVVNPLDNTISANITQAGYLCIGQITPQPELFGDGFEPGLCPAGLIVPD